MPDMLSPRCPSFPRIVAGLCALALIVGAGPKAAAAQPAPGADADTTQVTFDEAIRLALDQNTDLKRAQSTVRGSDSQLLSEWMDFAPSVNLNSNVSRNFGQSFDNVSGELISQSTDFLNMGAGLQFTVFNGFERLSSLQQAQEQAGADQFNLRRTQREVVFTVMEQFINLFEAREVVEVQREEVDTRQQQLRQIRALVDAGSRPVSELYQQQADVAEAEQSLLQAQRDAEVRRTELAQTLQLDPRETYRFQVPGLPGDTAEAIAYDPSALVDEALSNRLDLRRERADRRAANEEIQQAKSEYYPSLSFSASWDTDWSSRPRPIPIDGTGSPPQQVAVPTQDGGQVTLPVPGTGQDPQFRDPSFSRQLNDNLSGRVSLSLEIPIFDRWQRESQVEQAQVQAQNARYDVQDTRQQIALEVRQTYFDYRNALQQLEAANARLKAARQARTAAQERYNLGSADIVELQNANRDFVQAASQQIRARYNLLFREKQIDFQVGRLRPTDPLFQ